MFALLAGGVADEELRPERWSSLLGRIGRGLEALPGVNVPYRGVDEDTMLALGVGGTLIAAAAAVLAFWPREKGQTGFRTAALILLVAVYAVPAVVLDFEGEFLRGALLALLVLAFLRLERLPVGDVPAAGVAAGVAAIVALAAAPLLDGREPWWDYERWAVDTAAARAVGFSWDHTYSPLDWPRDGREMLRVQARQAAYWKARDLDIFDGAVWRQDPRPRSEAVGWSSPRTSSRAARGPSRSTSRSATWSPTRSSRPGSRPRCGASRDPSAAASSPRPTGSGRGTRTRPTSTRHGRATGRCATPRRTTRTGCACTAR